MKAACEGSLILMSVIRYSMRVSLKIKVAAIPFFIIYNTLFLYVINILIAHSCIYLK